MARTVLNLSLIFCLLSTVACAVDILETKCATLYSQNNFQGDKFIVNDFDPVVSTRRDFRVSVNGWWETGSVMVENGCKVKLCDDTYFTGNCTVQPFSFSLKSSQISNIRSVSCTCEKQCSCEDVPVPVGTIGRMYYRGSCSTCDTEYVPFTEFEDEIDRRHLPGAIKIKSGCNLTLTSDVEGETKIFERGYAETQDFPRGFSGFKVSCNESDHLSQGYASNNEGSVENTDFLDVISNMQNGPQLKNVYILFLGMIDPSEMFGLHDCSGGKSFKECRIPILVESLNTTTELRIIYYDDESGRYLDVIEGNYQIMATLDDFLSNHEELNSTKPNAIIMVHYIRDRDLDKEDSQFQRKLQLLDTFRSRILNEDYSNVIHLLKYKQGGPMNSRYPEEIVSLAEKAVNVKYEFPKPTNIATFQRLDGVNFLPLVNGFRKLKDEEYWPMNIRNNLIRICEKIGDPYGAIVFKEAFKENYVFSNVTFFHRNWYGNYEAPAIHYRTCFTETPTPKNCSNHPENRIRSPATDTELSQDGEKLCPSVQAKYLELQKKVTLLEQQLETAKETSSKLEN